MRYVAIDPHSGEELRSFPTLSAVEMRGALGARGRERCDELLREFGLTTVARTAAHSRARAARRRRTITISGCSKATAVPCASATGRLPNGAGHAEEQTAVRDYYVALSEHAGVLWIYQTRLESEQAAWFLQGIFA